MAEVTSAMESPAEQATSPGLAIAVADSTAANAMQPQAAEVDEEPSVPASPVTLHNMQALLKRPFGDVLKEVVANLPLKSSAHLAAEQLRFLLHHDTSHVPDVLASPMLLSQLVALLRESPGLPAAGSAMGVLAMLALTPQGRAALREQGAVQPLIKFLTISGMLQKTNAEPALLLLQNMSCDKVCHQLMHKVEALPVLLELLRSNAAWLRQHPPLSAAIAGSLTNLVVSDSDSASAKQRFVKAGGIEVTCKALAEWGRVESPSTLRLRLLLSEISAIPQYTMKVQEIATDVSLGSSRQPATNTAQPGSSRTAAQPAAGQLTAAATAAAEAAVEGGGAGEATVSATETAAVAQLGKGVPLGTPRMPASDRITVEVLKHGRDNGDAAGDSGAE